MSRSVSNIVKLANKFEKKIAGLFDSSIINKMKGFEGKNFIAVGQLYKVAPEILRLYKTLENRATQVRQSAGLAKPRWTKAFDAMNVNNYLADNNEGIPSLYEAIMSFVPNFYRRGIRTPEAALESIMPIVNSAQYCVKIIENMASSTDLSGQDLNAVQQLLKLVNSCYTLSSSILENVKSLQGASAGPSTPEVKKEYKYEVGGPGMYEQRNKDKSKSSSSSPIDDDPYADL